MSERNVPVASVIERLRLFSGTPTAMVVMHDAADEIERLAKRLEIDSTPYDGIATRDETIRLLEKERDELLRETTIIAYKKLEAEIHEARRAISEAHAALGWAKATFDLIKDRHEDEEDVKDGPDGPLPNTAMETIVDCNQALDVIARATKAPK